MMTLIRLALLVSSVCIWTAVASADPRDAPTDPIARHHFELGGQLFGRGEFTAAIAEYKAGAMIEQAPVFYLALAQCYRMTDDYDNALRYFDAFLEHGHPKGKTEAGVQKLIQLIKDEQKRRLPTPPPPSPPPVPAPVPVAPPAPAAPPVPVTIPWYHDRVGWGLVGGSAVALGISTYFALDGRHLHQLSNTDPSEARRQTLRNQATTRYELGGAAAGVGLVLAISGTIRFVVHDSVIVTSHSVAIAVRF